MKDGHEVFNRFLKENKTMPTPKTIEEYVEEFNKMFPFAIIDWKIGRENDGDGIAKDTMIEVKNFLRFSLTQIAEDAKREMIEKAETEFERLGLLLKETEHWKSGGGVVFQNIHLDIIRSLTPKP